LLQGPVLLQGPMLLESLELLQGPVLLEGPVLLQGPNLAPRSGVTSRSDVARKSGVASRSGVAPGPDVAPRSSVTPASCPFISQVHLLSLRNVVDDGIDTNRRRASGRMTMDAIAEFHGRLSSWGQHVPVLVRQVRARQELEQIRL